MSESRPKSIGVLVLIGLLVCLVFCANAWKSSLRIKQIKIEGNRIVGTNEIVQLTQIPPAAYLYQADLTAIQRNVMSHHYVKDAVVERNLPNTIYIQVRERIPIALLNGSETKYLDEDGVVLPRSVSHKLFDLPMISGLPLSEKLALGSTITQIEIQEILQLLSALKTVNRPLYHNISEVQLRNGGDIILYAAEGGVPIIFGHGEVPSKLVRLETFWNDIVRTRGSQSLQYVDLRYQDQIIARWNTEPSTAKSL
jgi:cell division protein FtsQ